MYNNINKQLDWSNKIVNIEASNWNTRATNYGQKSILKFSNEDGVGDTGQAIINVDDTTLQEIKNVIEFYYSTALDVQRWTNLPY